MLVVALLVLTDIIVECNDAVLLTVGNVLLTTGGVPLSAELFATGNIDFIIP